MYWTKKTGKNHIFPINLKIQKPKKSELYKRHNKTILPLFSEKSLGKKNNHEDCGEVTNSIFYEKPEKSRKNLAPGRALGTRLAPGRARPAVRPGPDRFGRSDRSGQSRSPV
jgi:hypothetical protein